MAPVQAHMVFVVDVSLFGYDRERLRLEPGGRLSVLVRSGCGVPSL